MKILALAAGLLGILANPVQVAAQRYVQLIDWTSSWRYIDTGADLGTAWQANTYNDSSWPAGIGILAFETGSTYPAPFNTLLSMGPAPQVNDLTNYYFRIHFNYYASNFVAPLSLWCSNAVDDGCVAFLNGVEVGRIRVPANQTAATYATGTGPAEGLIEPFQIMDTNLLRIGDNVMAVEVHQVGATSSDIAWGMSMTAIVPTPVVFTSQPSNQLVNIGGAALLSATTTGGTVNYQWQTNNGSGVYINVAGATFTNYTFIPTGAGTFNYRLLAANGVNTATSSVAVVTVVRDTFGPLLVSATVLEEATVTNKIELAFSENLFLTSVHAPINGSILTNDTFRVVLYGSNVVVGISNSTYSPGTYPNCCTLPKVTLRLNTTNWFNRSNYYVIVNNVRDGRTNVIAPNSVIGVSWPMSTNIFTPSGQYWKYHANWLNDMLDLGTDIYTTNWWQNSYTESGSWAGPVNNVLYHDQENTNESCFIGIPLQEIGHQDQPTLFRTWFMWPTNGSTNVTLKLSYAADDSAAFYLNGTFLVSDTSFPSGPITSSTRSGASSEGNCRTNTISNVPLRRGSNLLAVAVAQYRPPAPGTDAQPFDIVWALQLDAVGFQSGPLPPTSLTNRITVSHPTPDTIRMSWATNAYGWALVYSTNILKSGNSNFFERELLQEQPNMQNMSGKPTTLTNPPNPRRFYQLIPTQDRSLFP